MQRLLTIRGRACALCLLLQSLIHFSASVSSNLYVSSHVGQLVVLPCNWTSHAGTAESSLSPYLWWETPKESVFELQGNLRFEGPDYKGRVDVEPQSFEGGDCSLHLREVRFSDKGLYESFVGVGRRRRFIRSVELNVRDYKYSKTLAPGQHLYLTLHTPQAATVIFQGCDVSEADIIWQRGGRGSRQGRLTEGERELVLLDVKLEDSGTYRVMDPQGLSISTVQLRVEEVQPEQSAPERKSESYFEDARNAHSSAFRASGMPQITSSLLFFGLHLLFWR